MNTRAQYLRLDRFCRHGWHGGGRLHDSRRRSLRKSVSRGPGAIASIAFLWVVFAAPAAVAQSQSSDDSPTPSQSDPVFQTWRKHPGVQTCAPCHYQSAGSAEFATRDTSFSRQNELSFWLNSDKHAIARRRVEPLSQDELLDEASALLKQLEQAGITLDSVPSDWFGASNVLSRRICDKLGYDVATPKGYSRFRDHCLSCHGGYRGEEDASDFARGGTEQPGISCNYCHQLGENTRWINEHGVRTTNQAWRLRSPQEKADAGMRDLVDTANQATLCFDCHIGNRARDQFVTHSMYAAGHPPLPSIELQTFCEQMPQHWRTLSQLHESLEDPAAREEYFEVNFPELFRAAKAPSAGETFWNTRKMLIGAVKARQQTLDLILQSARSDQWADYALYDCAACHHELRRPSERQQRGFPAAPGRPRQHEWPSALLTVALDTCGQSEPAEPLERQLTAAFGQQPFGDPTQVEPAAQQLRDQLAAAVDALQSQPVDAGLARQCLTALADTPSEEVLVYDAARQVVWAMQVVARELSAEGVPLNSRVQQLIVDLDQPATGPDSTGIAATLPAGRQKFIYPASLRADLQRRAAFDPDTFVTRLREIHQRLVASAGESGE